MDLIKHDMTDIWAVAGDVVQPDSSKIRSGWAVEPVPRQWWNWFENRQDNNIAYMLQKGFPEWDATTEYIINKSYVQRNGIVYKATATNTNTDPISLTSWVRAFVDYSTPLAALGTLTPAADKLPYFTGTSGAAVTTFTSFARSILDDVDAASVRTTIGAQALNANLTALSGVSPALNVLPYFTSTTTMAGTNITAFGRSILDDADAAAGRATLDVNSTGEITTALNGKQPLDATLTAAAGVTTAANTLSYWTGVDTAAVTALTAFARTLLDDADAATARATLALGNVDNTSDVNKPVSTAQQTALNNKQDLSTKLTALSGLTWAANTVPYFTGTATVATSASTAFGRGLWNLADAAALRTSAGLGTAAIANVQTSAADTTAGNVLTVGAFGLGAPLFLSNIDAFNPSGFYAVTGATTGPVPAGFTNGSLIVMVRNPGPTYRAAQILTSEFTGRVWTRMYTTSWTSWVQTLDSSDVAVGRQDDTDGKLLKVGDHGIGGQTLLTILGTEIDDLRSNGFYYCSSGANQGSLPSSTNGYLTNRSITSVYVWQEYTTVNLGLRYSRTLNNGVWTAWSADGNNPLVWTNLTFASGWTWNSAEAASYYQPSYAIRNNTVYLRGKVTKAASIVANEGIFTLPVGFRPLRRKVLTVFFDSSTPLYFGSCTIFINTTGVVQIVALAAGSTSTSTDNHVLLDGIFFDIG
jgi:hypothetical protein